MLTSNHAVARTGLDAAALKPAECDVRRALELPFDAVTIDYEGREHLPDTETLAELAVEKDVRLTVPVRADGFDPLGDDSLYDRLPEGVKTVLVAGHPAYLTEDERRRAVAPRFGAALDREPDAWVGTEGVERVATATGAAQFELLTRSTARDLRALRAAGFDATVAVYAPTVLTDDEDAVLDAVGAYVARRKPVARALPETAQPDARAAGRAREVLSAASRDFALVGTAAEVGERVAELKDAGADWVVGYPARGVESFLG
ncbi:LLM class flavin-dependent oxidoreductase [Haladaptatus salinisoli]|uniref:LLM class flavin-dependent oxidoreductase n=1 Tax=Haladaptatus salinisoli TaxID=2884876 RepID=UPI001D09DB4F|nr:LLM class flavin-dependent oxidoreductase [Haladaptatus salinisoli]